MNKNIKRKIITAAAAALIAFSAVSGAVMPAHAAIGTSVNEEVINQARAVASVIQTRVQLYWSMWVDKQIPYTQDPLSNPEPTWATDAEIALAVGGYDIPGIVFSVENMPQDRQGSFYLSAVVGEDLGGAAAASYVRNFLPMAVASGSTVTVPVLRPSFALGLSDLMDNPNKVNRDGSTNDGSPTFSDGSTIRFGDGGTITFDGTGGDISNVNTLSARDGSFSNNLTVGNKLTAADADIENADIGTLTAGDTTINGTLDVSGQITGNLTGNVTGNTNGTHTGAVIGDVTGNSSTATRLATARTIALKDGATGTATAFNGTANITIPVTSLNAGYLSAGTIPTARLAGNYNIGITGKATTAGAADTARYASTTGLLKDTDGDTPGQFTMRTTSGGVVEFGGTTPRTSVTFGGSGVVQPADYWFGSAGTGVLHGQSTSATKLHNIRTIALGTGATGTATNFDGTANIVIPVTDLNADYLTAGTVDAARLSGLYNIAISGKANTAGQADNATNVNGGTVNATTGTFSGALTANGVSRFNNDITIYGSETDRGIIFDGSSGNTAKWRLYDIASGSGDTNYFKLQTTGSGGTVYADVLRFGMDTKDAVFSGNILPAANNSKNLGSATYKFANIYATNLNGALTGNASSATKLATARTIALGTGATGTATAFDGTGNIVIPVTAIDAAKLNTGTVPTARLSGTYNIGVSGKAATAGAADTATSATSAATATNVSGGSVNATTGTFSGSVTTNGTFVTNGGDMLLKAPVTTGGWARGLSYVSSDGATKYGGIGMLGSGTTPSSFYIGWGDTPYAPTYGITMGTTGVTALKGSLNVSNGITGALTGNASTATKLATAKTIALNTGATGTATAFDGTANITIPITSLNASYLYAGTVAADRLAGTYNIGISGKAATAGAADTAANATYAATAGQATNATTADSATTAATAAQAQKLYSTDKRSVSTTPDSYKSALSFEGLKFESAIGSPSGNTYSYLLGLRGWNDNSGGNAHEIAFNNSGIYVRKGGTNWETWSKLLTSVNVENYNAGSATQLAAARTIALNTAATGTPTAFNGTANISIPVTALNAAYLNSGTVAAARMSGTYNIGISGKAATAGAADTASSATKLATARSINGVTFDGTSNITVADDTKLPTTGGTMTGKLVINNGVRTEYNVVSAQYTDSYTGAYKITLPVKHNGAYLSIEIEMMDYGQQISRLLIGGYLYTGTTSWYNPSLQILGGYNKGVTTGYDTNGYACIYLGTPTTGWYWNKISVAKVTFGNGTADGTWSISRASELTGTGLTALTPNNNMTTQYARSLTTPRTISIGTGATGTATAFDGTANITIPITALNAGYLSAGTIPTARLSGTYAIGISGNAGSASKLAASRTINGVGFDGTSNITVADATKLSLSGGTLTGVINLPGIGMSWIGGLNSSAPLNHDASPSPGSYYPILKQKHTSSTFNIGGYNNSFGIYRYVNTRTENGYDSSFVMNAAGDMVSTGKITAPTFTGALTGNASTATQLAVARTIALGTGVTGTATAFNGTANITIPVTALNAGYLSSGTIPAARLTGLYGIDISGTAELAKALRNPITSVAYATTAGTASVLAAGSSPGNHEFYSIDTANSYSNAGIEIREVGLVTNSQSSDAYAPMLAFHWGGRVQSRILLASDGNLKISGSNATPQTIVHAGNIANYAAGNVTTPSGTYKHLGAWGVGRTAAGAILVNTAYTADRASYADSAGSAPGGMRPNWSGMVSKAASFTAPSDGYLLVKPKLVTQGHGQDAWYYTVIPSISIAGKSVQDAGKGANSDSRTSAATFVAPVASGNAIVVSASNGGVYFIPKY